MIGYVLICSKKDAQFDGVNCGIDLKISDKCLDKCQDEKWYKKYPSGLKVEVITKTNCIEEGYTYTNDVNYEVGRTYDVKECSDGGC